MARRKYDRLKPIIHHTSQAPNSVCVWVWVCVLLQIDIQTWILACRSSGRICRSSWKVKVIGQSLRSPGQKQNQDWQKSINLDFIDVDAKKATEECDWTDMTRCVFKAYALLLLLMFSEAIMLELNPMNWVMLAQHVAMVHSSVRRICVVSLVCSLFRMKSNQIQQCLVTLRIHDTLVPKTTANMTYMPFLCCHLITTQGRPYKVYISLRAEHSTLISRKGSTEICKMLVSFSSRDQLLKKTCLSQYIKIWDMPF